jgi:hypothetical protein
MPKRSLVSGRVNNQMTSQDIGLKIVTTAKTRATVRPQRARLFNPMKIRRNGTPTAPKTNPTRPEPARGPVEESRAKTIPKRKDRAQKPEK